MKLISVALEKRAIRTLASPKSSISSTMLALLTPDDFGTPASQEMFKRVLTLAQKRGKTPGWEELITDPAISESVRKIFGAYKKKPLTRIASVKTWAQKLHEYRKIRQLYYMSEYVNKKVQEDKVDSEELFDEITNRMTEARTGGDIFQSFMNVGGKDPSFMKTVNKILKGDANRYIPTGFSAFDKMNGGLFLGSLMVVAASTGGGKSTLAQVMGLSMAKYGAKVCMVSLEMEKEEMAMRILANISGISMTKLIKPQEMTIKEKNFLRLKARKLHKRVKKIQSLYSVITPDEDITIEELLFMAKPMGYNVFIIDYINLLKGMDEVDQWRKLGAAARFAKRFASMNKCVVILLTQLSEEGIVRYSRAIGEHASNMWTWVYGPEAREKRIIEVRQPKARNQKAFNFLLKEEFDTMRITDLDPNEVSKHVSTISTDKPDRGGKGFGKKKEPSGKKKQSYNQKTDDEDYYMDADV